jgi:hypothetical protein
MARLFSFRGEVEWEAQRADTIFTYIPPCGIVPSDIERKLVSQLGDAGISPDLLVFVTPEMQYEIVIESLKSELLTERFDNLKRCKGIGLAQFNKKGDFLDIIWIKCATNFIPPNSDQILVSARNAGFACLTGRHGVITQAPPGAYFRNPSQCPRSYFIRAALLCRNSVEASFISFTLLPLVAKAEAIYNKIPNVIWVDTVSIAYIAYALSELCMHLNVFSSEPEIRSHSSYSGLPDTSPEIGDYPIFLISASTSGGMARDLISCSGGRIKQETISTILGSFEASFPQLLYAIPESQRGRNIESAVDTLREILVSGEDFLFSPGEPIAVVLKRTQLPKHFPRNFKKIQGKGLIHHFKRFNANKKSKAFFIEGTGLAADSDFKEWLVSKAKGMLPASVNRIVYQDDEGSKQMAEIIRVALEPFHSPLAISSVEEIEVLPPQNDETVAIVAAVAGSGMELMRITKALRRFQPEGSRFFFIGAVLARNYMQLEQFKSNLRLAKMPLTYAVETWCEYAASTEAIYEYSVRETELLGDIVDTSLDSGLVEFAEIRRDTILKQGVVHENSPKIEPFISASGDDAAFDLSKGFALWDEFDKNRCPIDVLFSVSCWLQNARECNSLAHEDRLDGGGFQQAIIAPDCFLRFTDPVIQVSILRCAHDSELDYRSSLAASARAAEIISKFLTLREESVTEFLMALVLKRMRLRKQDNDRVRLKAKSVLSDGPPFLRELVMRYEKLEE